jgi:flagellin-like protein
MWIQASYELNNKTDNFQQKNRGMRKMSIKRMLTSKKAISPILATLLLIVIAVAAIVVTYAWITTYMGSTTQQAGVILYHENVSFYNSTTQVVIGNSGTANTQIVRAYLGTSSESLAEVTDTYTNLDSNLALNAGSTATLTIDWPNNAVSGNWTAGQVYYFRIVPNPGQFYTFQVQAPQ